MREVLLFYIIIKKLKTMKILKWIAIVMVLLIAVPLTVALFVDGSYAVEREVSIAKPKD